MLLLIAINFIFIIRYCNEVFKKNSFKYLLVFGAASAIFILLLPLGGYRAYRPSILRYDITIPLTVYLIVVIEAGIILLLLKLKSKSRNIFILIVAAILILFWSKNFPIQNSRKEQQEMLTILSMAKTDSVVCLPYSSYLFSWEKIDIPEKSYYVRQMLYDWGITSRQVVFYQK
jgi:hypothetical protein